MMQKTRNYDVVEIGNYSKAYAVSMRHDITATFVRLITEIGGYSEDGLNILIDNGWLEEPPQAKEREALAKKH